MSESNPEHIVGYICDQVEHHRKFSYQEEVRQLLKRHRIALDGVIFGNNVPRFGRHFRAISWRRLPMAEARLKPWAVLFSPFGQSKMSKFQASLALKLTPMDSRRKLGTSSSWNFCGLGALRVARDLGSLQSQSAHQPFLAEKENIDALLQGRC